MTQIPGYLYNPDIAILTALPKEYAAVEALLDYPIRHSESDSRGTRRYLLGSLPALDGGQHAIALHMVGVGNNISASATTQLLNDLPTVRTLILCGIAGGAPDVSEAENHVRLGDVVVSGDSGIIQYDFVKEEAGEIIDRHPPRPPSANLLRAARILEAESISGRRPWDTEIDLVLATLRWKRPPTATDKLASSEDKTVFIQHPVDKVRLERRPRVFIGAIASSNRLLKNPKVRDNLRRRFGVKAVEMEGSGTADAAWMSRAEHFVVRGICDYCDSNKGDNWQEYAAAAAAGYLKILLSAIHCEDKKKVDQR